MNDIGFSKPRFSVRRALSDAARRAPYRVGDWALDAVLRLHPAARNSNYVAYAERELRIAGWYDEDAFYGDMMPKAVLRSMRLNAVEGHSGMSAGLANSIIGKLSMFEPLTPLTGDDDEWQEIASEDGEPVFQNTRSSRVFKHGDDAYDIDGKVFREPSGAKFTSRDSRVPVTFPYMPTTEIVDVKNDSPN